MDLQTKYITVDEFRQYTGIDLHNEMKEGEPETFLKRIEVRMASYLDANYFQNVDKRFPEFSEYQKKCYKFALLEQALYIFKNGDISVDSAYDPERGIIADNNKLKELSLSPNAKEQLINCGLLTRKIKTSNYEPFFGWRKF